LQDPPKFTQIGGGAERIPSGNPGHRNISCAFQEGPDEFDILTFGVSTFERTAVYSTRNCTFQDYQKTGVFVAQKYFSIDRVFRNETLDATHLAEFHQVQTLDLCGSDKIHSSQSI
jgi:hypothetical protein